ncbi:MAG: methyltransferase domain-containing protein [Actinomycetota bacterium]
MNGSRATIDLFDAAHIRFGDRVLDVGRRTDIARLPFEDASFDVLVCRQRLQLFPDRGLALSEMRRVLVDGGRMALSVGGSIERSAAFAALADSLERHAGVRVAATVRSLFSLSDPDDLRASVACAGFTEIRLGTARETISLPSVKDLLRFVPRPRLDGSRAALTDQTQRVVIAELERELAPWVAAEGVELTLELNTAVARR